MGGLSTRYNQEREALQAENPDGMTLTGVDGALWEMKRQLLVLRRGTDNQPELYASGSKSDLEDIGEAILLKSGLKYLAREVDKSLAVNPTGLNGRGIALSIMALKSEIDYTIDEHQKNMDRAKREWKKNIGKGPEELAESVTQALRTALSNSSNGLLENISNDTLETIAAIVVQHAKPNLVQKEESVLQKKFDISAGSEKSYLENADVKTQMIVGFLQNLKGDLEGLSTRVLGKENQQTAEPVVNSNPGQDGLA